MILVTQKVILKGLSSQGVIGVVIFMSDGSLLKIECCCLPTTLEEFLLVGAYDAIKSLAMK